ncbi:hypothetical protein [uncultured Desulfovibrio sp.]|uniref:hypothetical protein n=1 Tax=uncultured Desulfovibrio sp. TaxID=167968 RepID=UPI00039A775E|nr:hypothetical protein [uncultured Desulfovibrio sp.]
MPEQQELFQNAVWQLLEAVMFENWLRFYFISEKPDAPAEPYGETPLFLAVPDKGMERIKGLYPHLLPLAEDMNGREVDFETSRRAVCTFVLDNMDGKSMPKGMAATIFESATFQIQMQLFNAWVQMHEDQLDQGFLEFGAWRKLFAQWRETSGGRKLADRLALAGQDSAARGGDTVH